MRRLSRKKTSVTLTMVAPIENLSGQNICDGHGASTEVVHSAVYSSVFRRLRRPFEVKYWIR